MTSLLYEVKKEIAWIRFNKPEILNAFDAEECRHFVKVLKEATEDKNVKAIILSSIGPAFSAGDDLKAALEEYSKIQSGEIHPIKDIIEDITENLQEIPRIIMRAPKVVISAVPQLFSVVPWNPATTTTNPSFISSFKRSVLISSIRALP